MITRELTIEGRTIRVAPTPLSYLSDIKQRIGEAGIQSSVGVRALCEAIYWGARRAGADPDLTAEWIDMNVDMHNAIDVFKVFADVNGYQSADQSSGNAGAAGSQS